MAEEFVFPKSPAYRKLLEQRNSIILRPFIQMHPNPTNPVGFIYRTHNMSRILSTIPPPSTQDFPLRFQIADGLDGSGNHTVYNQVNINMIFSAT